MRRRAQSPDRKHVFVCRPLRVVVALHLVWVEGACVRVCLWTLHRPQQLWPSHVLTFVGRDCWLIAFAREPPDLTIRLCVRT